MGRVGEAEGDSSMVGVVDYGSDSGRCDSEEGVEVDGQQRRTQVIVDAHESCIPTLWRGTGGGP